MFCKRCQYALWNLRERICPECGQPFLPSEYEFVANSVRFCCPQCGQDYYGTGPRGHLVPREFDCIGCGEHLDMDRMVLLPTEGIDERRTIPEPMPWLEKGFGRFPRRWASTAWRGLFTPARLMSRTPAPSGAGPAIGFAALNIALAGSVSLSWTMVLIVVGGAGIAGLLVAVPIGIAVWFVLFLLWALTTHVILWISGSHAYGLGRTVQALGYTSGAALFCSVPCVGIYVLPLALLAWIVAAAGALREAQGVGLLRASAAAAAPPVLAGLTLTLGVTLVVVPGVRSSIRAASAAAAASQAGSVPGIRALALAVALRQAAGRDGSYPAEPAELAREPGVDVGSFALASVDDPLAADTILVGDLPLSSFRTASPQRAAQALELQAERRRRAGEKSPRLGDLIFVYEGLDPAASDASLWVFYSDSVVATASRFGRQPPAPPGPVRFIGLSDGTITRVDAANFAAALEAQNALRASRGLPLIAEPDAGGVP
jgi:hypothetical protein